MHHDEPRLKNHAAGAAAILEYLGRLSLGHVPHFGEFYLLSHCRTHVWWCTRAARVAEEVRPQCSNEFWSGRGVLEESWVSPLSRVSQRCFVTILTLWSSFTGVTQHPSWLCCAQRGILVPSPRCLLCKEKWWWNRLCRPPPLPRKQLFTLAKVLFLASSLTLSVS